MENYTELLKSKRKEKKLTQKEVAKHLGISEANYSKIERQLVKLDYYKAQVLANLLGVNIKNLIDISIPYSLEDSISIEKDFLEYLEKNIAINLSEEDVEKEYEVLSNKYADILVDSASNREIYIYVQENCEDSNYDWLLDKNDSLDEFMEKVAIYILKDKLDAYLLEVTESKYEIKEIINSAYSCDECECTKFEKISGSEEIDGKVLCVDCYDNLDECSDCGSKVLDYQYGKCCENCIDDEE